MGLQGPKISYVWLGHLPAAIDHEHRSWLESLSLLRGDRRVHRYMKAQAVVLLMSWSQKLPDGRRMPLWTTCSSFFGNTMASKLNLTGGNVPSSQRIMIATSIRCRSSGTRSGFQFLSHSSKFHEMIPHTGASVSLTCAIVLPSVLAVAFIVLALCHYAEVCHALKPFVVRTVAIMSVHSY